MTRFFAGICGVDKADMKFKNKIIISFCIIIFIPILLAVAVLFGFQKIQLKSIEQTYGVESDDVVDLINKTDKRRANYYNYYTGMKWGRAENYHLALRTDCVGIEGAVETLIQFVEAKNALEDAEKAAAK